MSIELWTILTAAATATVCALCGCLLMVSGRAMVSEGLSHAILPGLVLAFFVFRDYSSPWLIITAAATGMVMVWFTQGLQRTRLVEPDAGLGIVFATMFSVGRLLVTLKLRNTHFHADCIIEGNLTLAPLDRLQIAGIDLGPKSWVAMLVMLAAICCFLTVAWKELKVAFFDPLLAQRFRLRPAVIHFVSLSLISLTTVAGFNVAGSILIVALMMAPPAAAYLLSKRFATVLILSCVFAIVSSFVGFWMARGLDVSPTAPIASAAGLIFLLVFIAAPQRGLISQFEQRGRVAADLERKLVLETVGCSDQGETLQNIAARLHWKAPRVERAVRSLVAQQKAELCDQRVRALHSKDNTAVQG